MSKRRTSIVFVAAAALAGCSGDAPPNAPEQPGVVATDRGLVQGIETAGTWAYLGIPYAAPPVGTLRWAAPVPHDRWSGALDARAFGSRCVQPNPLNAHATIGNEDCLSLNVWAPSGATSRSGLPVLVFDSGNAAEQWTLGTYLWDGADLAARTGSIVVTLNYRGGVLGFLAHGSLGEHAGNYGLLDQLAALRWVQTNIAEFGGDRARVLLFGVSQSADAVCDLVASPLSKGLMSAALMESGRCTAVTTAAAAQTTAQTLAHAVGCDTVADPARCLRDVDAGTVTLAGKGSNWLSTIDGLVLQDVPWKVIASGAHNHIPFIVGSNSAETAQDYFRQYPAGMTEEQYEAVALAAFGGDRNLTEQAMALYPPKDFGGDPRAALIAASTDGTFGCIARFTARAFASGQREPVWRYYFTHALDNDAPWHAQGAWHVLETVFVFGHVAKFDGAYQPSAAEDVLSADLAGYWSRLAANGDPNGSGAVAWPRYDATRDTYLQLDETTQAGEAFLPEKCGFWDAVLGLAPILR